MNDDSQVLLVFQEDGHAVGIVRDAIKKRTPIRELTIYPSYISPSLWRFSLRKAKTKKKKMGYFLNMDSVLKNKNFYAHHESTIHSIYDPQLDLEFGFLFQHNAEEVALSTKSQIRDREYDTKECTVDNISRIVFPKVITHGRSDILIMSPQAVLQAYAHLLI